MILAGDVVVHLSQRVNGRLQRRAIVAVSAGEESVSAIWFAVCDGEVVAQTFSTSMNALWFGDADFGVRVQR